MLSNYNINMTTFIHFGCWNKGGCYLDNPEKGWNDLSSVMRNLRTIAETDRTLSFIAVAGDNYYPDIKKDKTTGTKIKKIITKDLMSGLECLPDNVPVNILLGNHDVESDLPVDNKKEPDEDTKCYILDKETEFARSRRENTTLNTYNSRIFNNDTLVLMIDTTIYEDDDDVGLKCYRHMYGNSTLTLEDLRYDQQNFVERIITNMPTNIKNIVIIGHYPITGYKVKNGKSSLIKDPGYTFVNLLYESIYEKIDPAMRNEINYYYLCADLHQYQIANIQINREGQEPMIIKQYIVGTGGTTLDPYPFDNQENYGMREIQMRNKKQQDQFYSLIYYMTPEQIKLSGSRHGFLQCTDVNGSLAFKFLDSRGASFVEEMYSGVKWNTIGGKKKSVKKYKQIKTKKNKQYKFKGGSYSGIIELSPNAKHDNEIDYERCLQTPEFISLLSSFEAYKEGLIYISFGSADSRDQLSNANEQMIPSFLLSQSYQRRNMEHCNPKCKILCISIDGINTTSNQLADNVQIVNDRIATNQNIDFVFINIKNFMDEFGSFQPARSVAETQRLNYTISDKICRALIDSKIDPMNVMIVNYVKFRNAIENSKDDVIEKALPLVLLDVFDSHGYGNSVYDWFGYFINLNLKGFIYKIKFALNEKNKQAYQMFLFHIFKLMQMSKINTLYDSTPQLFSPLYFHFFKYIYPISSVPLHYGLKNSNIDNNFTYSLSNFLDNDTRALPAWLQTATSGGKKNNSKTKNKNKYKLKNKTKRLENKRKKNRKTIKKRNK